MRNMKIPVEINKQGESTLNEIVRELERLGCVSQENKLEKDDKAIIVIDGKYFGWWHTDNWSIPLTTLAEIRSMSIETLKEM